MKKKRLPATAYPVVREPLVAYGRIEKVPCFFGKPVLKGEYARIDAEHLNTDVPVLFYSHPNFETAVTPDYLWDVPISYGPTEELVSDRSPQNGTTPDSESQ